MIYFQWERIDWIKWMPVEVAVLVLLIVAIRICRRLNRWGPSRVSHVTASQWDFQGQRGALYRPQIDPSFPFKAAMTTAQRKYWAEKLQNPVDAPHGQPSQRGGNILYVHALTFAPKSGHPIPTALSLLGAEVYCMEALQFHMLTSSTAETNTFFRSFIHQYDIRLAVAFDHATGALLQALQSAGDPVGAGGQQPTGGLDVVILRPTGAWSDIQPWHRLLGRPLELLAKLKLHGLQRRLKKRGGRQQLPGGEMPSHLHLRSLTVISPHSTWLSDAGRAHVEGWLQSVRNAGGVPHVCHHHFQAGDWWFFRNELLVLALIARVFYGDGPCTTTN